MSKLDWLLVLYLGCGALLGWSCWVDGWSNPRYSAEAKLWGVLFAFLLWPYYFIHAIIAVTRKRLRK